MLPKLEFRNSNNTETGDSNNGQLLRDIEEISKALYLHKSSSSNARSKSAGRVRLSESKSSLINQRVSRADSLHKDKKSSSAWNWKKPLKALAHIGDKKFHCRFYLHAHSIEGLPGNFEGLSLCVRWKRKNEVVQTSPSKVSRGSAEFEETLITRCSVYGSNGGPNHPVKYESKHFLVYPCVVEAPSLDIGKQWVDLTNFLPRSLEELEGEKSRGQWNTSFNLSGKAKGAILNVSFGFWVMRDKLPVSNGFTEFPELTVKSNRSSPDNGNGVTGNLNYGSSGLLRGSLDVKLCREVLLRTGLELSSSISCLYQKLDEGSLQISDETSYQEPEEEHKAKLDLGFISAEEIDGYDWDIIELSITEVGTETSENEDLILDRAEIERIGVDETSKGGSVDYDSKSGDVVVTWKGEMQNLTKGLAIEEMHSVSDSETPESMGSKPLMRNECVEPRKSMDAKEKYKRSRSSRRSLSLDAVAETVASDFFKMLGLDNGSFRASSDCDPESPREILLREFEEEALASGHLAFDFDAKHEESCFPRTILSGLVEDSELSLVLYDSEEEHKRVGGRLLSRRNAKILEDLETEALMRDWGLKENDFGLSPRSNSGGFGSPIEFPPEEIRPRPPLGEGFGSFVEMKNGGFLRSMNPLLFGNAKNGGDLIIQVSNPAVFPAKMGFDVMEIVQNLALLGAEALYEKINRLVPLLDITGKTIKQVASDADSRDSASNFREVINDLESDHHLVDGESMERSSLKDLSPLVVNKIEGLFLEGLKIQSRMSSEESHSCIFPRSENTSEAITDLVSLSMTLDEWLSLEAENTVETLSKILIENQATGNDLIMISHLVQLLNPLRNHEPVGSPMLLLIQVQRAEEGLFRAIRAHLVGVRLSFPNDEKLWGSSSQQQSGARWLLSSGLARTTVTGFASKSKSIVGPSRLGFAGSVPRDILWSVSSNMHGISWERNPDVVFRSDASFNRVN